MADRNRVTQLGVETISIADGPVRVTQLGVETISIADGPVRVTQLGVEVIMSTEAAPLPAGMVINNKRGFSLTMRGLNIRM